MYNTAMDQQRFQNYFFLLLLVGIVLLTFRIFSPFVSPLVVAATFAVIFQPLFAVLLRFIPQRSLAALVATLSVFVIVVAPLSFFGTLLFQEARALYVSLDESPTALPQSLTTLGQEQLDALVPTLSFDITDYTRQILSWLFANASTAFSSAVQFLASTFLAFLALYYFFKDGGRLIEKLTKLSPLRDRYDVQIFDRLRLAVVSVIKGSLMIAMLQGLAATLGFMLFGVPHPVLWGSITIVAALIPHVGTGLVVVPAVGYLFFTGNVAPSVALAIWGITAVGLIDNLLGPKLIERGLRIHPFLILLAVLGGLIMFGPVGFLLGPIVLSLLFALLDIYQVLIIEKQTAA